MRTTSRMLAWGIGCIGGAVLATSESPLPTSAMNIAAAANAAQSVMICRLTDLGWVDFRGPGATAYDEAKFDVITTLKGQQAAKVVCSLVVLGPPIDANEKAPVVGESYVVMGDSKSGKFTLRKLLAATPDNIAKVRHLLSNPAPGDGAPAGSATRTPPSPDQPRATPSPSPREEPRSETAPMPREEPGLSPPWSIILVSTGAVLGLLWLLFKRRL